QYVQKNQKKEGSNQRESQMGWRILHLMKPCKISVKNKQLFYEPGDGESFTLPIEDLSVVVFDTQYISLSAALLAAFAEHGVVAFSCDQTHQPSGVFLPYHEHSRYSEMAHLQIAASEPLKKRIWSEIVRQKILNQAAVLELLEKNNSEMLVAIAGRISSGDPDNREGYAASIYWKSLFEDFVRRDDGNIINSALNYGYAILRGCVARNVVATGLLPCFGVHHSNNLNQFNLVDDLIEPYRPFVDYIVANMNFGDATSLTPALKKELVSAVMHTCYINDNEIQILKAVEITAESCARAIRDKDFRILKLPEFKGPPRLAQDGE
ncbi:MAG: type II CRISPR-associated endonuclease Cas1, partial [Alphaproteobacteria bacterium]|nr:type II CRISPR-associated endonuclease Cas1 [Alphaproteobacteria bacterium]